MSNDTDHKHPACNDDECKGDKAINKNDVVNTDVNVDKMHKLIMQILIPQKVLGPHQTLG